MDLARRGIARHVYSAEEARPICRLLFRERGAKHPEGRSNQKSIGLTPHPPALNLPEDPSHTVLRSEPEGRPERTIAGP